MLYNHVSGCVIGAAYGDALGKSTEFMSKWQINNVYGEKIILGKCVQDTHRNAFSKYDWTDDYVFCF
jgi:ADP-ribosylglycohydrolase